jgi:hypothetical protein
MDFTILRIGGKGPNSNPSTGKLPWEALQPKYRTIYQEIQISPYLFWREIGVALGCKSLFR